MTREHYALLNVIEEFKPEEISTLEASLNVISNHAAKIKELMKENDHLRDLLKQIISTANKARDVE